MLQAMRSRLAARNLTLSLLVALLMLGLVACGGDDGDDPAVDVDALEACLDEDPATDIARDDGGLEDVDLAEQPTDQWTLTPTETGSMSFPVPSYVLVFPDEKSADAALADIGDGDSDLFIVGEKETVRWVIIESDDSYSDDLDATISDCVDEAG